MVFQPFRSKLGHHFYPILAILVVNRVWFLHSNLDMHIGTFLRGSQFFIIIKLKSPSKIEFTVI